jgi:hypothetical protein
VRLLGVLLCYNDADILEYAIEDLLESDHDIIVWGHGSNDATAEVLDKFGKYFIERDFIPRSYDFYKLYQRMSKRLISEYIDKYDWISWPDQDEFLEGLDRKKTYRAYVEDVWHGGYDWIQFNNFNYWHTADDDTLIASPIDRIKHYSIFPDCAPRIRSWRASKTNIRKFNHNAIDGLKYPFHFNLRHYPMRTNEQMMRRILSDRSNIQKKGSNFHYANMSSLDSSILAIKSELLHFDNGISELNQSPKYNWRNIYGYGVSKKIGLWKKILNNFLGSTAISN